MPVLISTRPLANIGPCDPAHYDGGATFEILSPGLPQQDGCNLIYRHGLDVVSIGDRLVFGSTTGGLWVSESSGDQWRGISQNLPPIHAVRFI